MDLQQVTTILKELGIPAVITTVLLALVKAVSDALQRRSKQSLIDWLAQPSTMEPFKGDDRALRALHELQQLLVFERAFGLKTESGMRNELLLFAEHESLQLHEVLDAGRLFSGLSLPQLNSPERLNGFKNASRVGKRAGYGNLGFGYFLLAVSMYLATRDPSLRRGALTGIAVGLWAIVSGLYVLKRARRSEIAVAFLSWRSENQRTSLPSENSHAVQANGGTVA